MIFLIYLSGLEEIWTTELSSQALMEPGNFSRSTQALKAIQKSLQKCEQTYALSIKSFTSKLVSPTFPLSPNCSYKAV